VIESGLAQTDKEIWFEGVQKVKEDDKIQYVSENLKMY